MANEAYIDDNATWYQMTIDELEKLNIDKYCCSDNIKKSIKEFYINGIEKGYFFTDDMEYTEVGCNCFEYFIGYKETKDGIEDIKEFYEYYDDDDEWW